jgi:uncharacterized protein involved in outer membrane biogenesis
MKLQQAGLMKVWKSPVFHFGVLLVVAVIGLLIAPFIIDWNGYRSDLEAYGRKLTGRQVTVEGPVSARLFPWPRLTAENIAIANPPGMEKDYLASAGRITIHMTLMGLLRGGLDVESIEVEQPVVHLERSAEGQVNWMLSPAEDLIRSDVLSRVSLDQISLTGGEVQFRDRRRGETVRLEGFDAAVASPRVAGPWRVRATADYEGRPIELGINTASYAEGEPFRFGVRFSPADRSGLVYSFDGAASDGMAEGQIRIEPAAGGDGKTDAEGSLRPLVFTAKAKGDFERVAFTNIEVSRLGPGETGAIATGEAALTLGRQIAAEVDLRAAMLDIDALAGAQSRNILREAGSLAVAESLLELLPPDMDLSGRLRVTALKSGGQNLDNVDLDVDARRGELKINRFAAGLPGRSEMLFKGVYVPAAGGAELSGELGLESNDLRALTLWLWHEGERSLGALWTGSRGRLKMQTGISLTPSQVRLTDTEFELDGERGKGALTVTSAGRGLVDLTLEGGRFDVDSYAPQGIPTFSAAARNGVGGIAAFALPRPDSPDIKLRVQAGELLLNKVTARDVDIDLQSGSNGLYLRALRIGAVGGARVDGTGLILDAGKGADGSIGLNVQADDPSELVRLFGLAGEDGLPPWARGLGPTAIRTELAVKPAEQGSDVALSTRGKAGPLAINFTGTADPLGALTGKLEIKAESSARILTLLGVPALEEDREPGALSLEAAGTMAEGFAATATLQAHGARLDYRGGFRPLAEGFGLAGDLSLRAADAARLIAASGLPVNTPGGLVAANARLGWNEGKWTLSDVSGQLGAAAFSGNASLTPERVADVRLETGPLRFADVLAATFLDWSGPGLGLESGFASALPLGLTGEIWLQPSELAVHPHFAANGAEIGIAASDGTLSVTMYGKDADGRGAQVEMTSTGSNGSRAIKGLVNLPVDLGRQLALINGAPVAEGEGLLDLRFETEGRSPAGALAAVRGEGSYKLEDFRLPGLTPRAFVSALAAAGDAEGITRAFDALRGGEGLAFGAVSGRLEVSEGQMNFDPVTHEDDAAATEVKAVAELALGQIDLDVSLRLKARDGLPPMSVSYSGPPMALARAENNSELATGLGVTIMREGIDELERLQQEQARLAKLEEEQRLADEERLQAYYAQRDELILRRRELKVHAEMQVMEADRLRRRIEEERAANSEINKLETRQRQRELRVWRRSARVGDAPPEQKSTRPATQAAPKPKAPRKPPGPVILAKPPGAPVVISPPPASSPSQ